jgi:hypothetical protein
MVPPVEPFVHNTNPGRVVFGAGQVARLGDEVERLGCSARSWSAHRAGRRWRKP